MTPSRFGGIFLAILMAHAACAMAPGDRFLDATEMGAGLAPEYAVELAGLVPVGPGLTNEVAVPLRVRLIGTDRSHYRRLEKVRYEVSLRNTSRSSIVIPWSATPIDRRARPASGYRHAVFEFILVRPDGSTFVADSVVLYGAPDAPDSLKTVAPGESVVLRLPATLTGNGAQDDTNPILNPSLKVRAQVGVVVYAPGDIQFPMFKEQFSFNTLPFTVVPTR